MREEMTGPIRATAYDLDAYARRSILVIGDVMLDRYLWGDVERISPEAPVPVCLVKRISEAPGGAGNVAANLVGLGASVGLIGLRGHDASGERLSKLLGHRGVDAHLLSDRARPTISKTRVMSTGQQLLRFDEEEISPIPSGIQASMLERVKTSLPMSQAVILSDYGKGVLSNKSFCQELIGLAKAYDIKLFVDPKGKDWERYRGATCITPNVKELEQVHGEAICEEGELTKAMRAVIHQYDLESLVVTRGPLGMSIMKRDEEPISVPAFAREVYDVSGAGDTVIATLALSVVAGHSLGESARAANLAGGIVVGKVGTQPISMLELRVALQSTGVDGAASFITRKLASRTAANVQVEAWKSMGDRIVFASGCFDLLHAGHIHLLQQARDLGDRVVVGLHGDALVRRSKGPSRPVVGERDRASVLASLQCVDLVVILDGFTEEDLLESLEPHVLVKGAEQVEEETPGDSIVKGYGGEIRRIHTLNGYSTTALRNMLLEGRAAAIG